MSDTYSKKFHSVKLSKIKVLTVKYSFWSHRQPPQVQQRSSLKLYGRSENNVSIKVAKYSGRNRVDLIENNEYGYCSLIKATKSVLDKIDLENHTATTITAKELMRVYKDLEMVEQLGSGIPRILETYGRECFVFSENFLRMVFPAIVKVSPQVTPQVTPQVERLLEVITNEHSRQELQEKLGLSDREYFRKTFLQPAIENGLIELTIPDKPKSSKQRYRLTQKGKVVLSQ